MNRIRNTKKDNNSIKYYVLLSVLVHLCIFLFANLKKDIALGDKIIPIEIIDIPSVPNKGEYSKRQEKRSIDKIRKKLLKEKIRKKKIKEEILKEDETLNIKESSEVKKNKNYISPSKNSSVNKEIGSEGKSNSNEVEKGSVKGKGEVKITCLNCKSPKYPPKALRRGAEGSPLIKVWINTKGNVVKSIILKSSGIESIDRAAIQAASESKFYPIESDTTLRIEYNLKIK